MGEPFIIPSFSSKEKKFNFYGIYVSKAQAWKGGGERMREGVHVEVGIPPIA